MNVFPLAEMTGWLAVPTCERAALALGLAVRFLGPRWGATQVAARLPAMLAATATGQYEFYFDAMGREVGFVNWSAPALPATGGPRPVRIHDFFARRGSLRPILADLRDRVLAGHDAALYVRHKPRLRITKQVSRADRTSFFRAAPALAADVAVRLTRDDHARDSYRRSFADAVELGECLQVLQRCDPHRRSPLWADGLPLRDLVALRQFRLYRDAHGVPAGLVTWAWLSPYTLARLGAVPLHRAHISEWNEGLALCLCDVLDTDASRAAILDDLCGLLLPAQQEALLYLAPHGAAGARTQQVDRRDRAALGAWMAARQPLATGASA